MRRQAVTVESDPEDNVPTPRSRSRGSYAHQSLSYAPLEPEVNIMPPTPPGDENANTKSANAAAMAQSTVRERKPMKTTKVLLKSVVHELHEQKPIHAPAPRNTGSRTPYRNGKLYLPDVTGITSAVGSPMKLGLEYKAYDGRDDREIDGGCLKIVHYREIDAL